MAARVRRHREPVSRGQRAERAEARSRARRRDARGGRGRMRGRRVHARGDQTRGRRLRARGEAAGGTDGEAAAGPHGRAVAARRRRRARRRDLPSAFDAGGPPEGGHYRSGGPPEGGHYRHEGSVRLQPDQSAVVAAVSTSCPGMIAFLRGRVLEKHPNRIVVDVNGVGYELYVPLSTYYEVGDAGAETELRVHTHVREDALQLFGFLTSLEQLLFERLIGISGIGPKLAIAVDRKSVV